MTRCGEQGVRPDDPAKRLTVHDRMAVGLAKSVSQSVSLQPVRDFLKSEAGSRFDGDYDILLQEVRNKPVHGMKGGGRSSSPTFGEVMFGGSAASNGRSSAAGGEALLDSLGALFPLMQIAIPALENQTVETWNTASHKPLVAVLPQDYQEGVTKTITAFDAEGREYEIDAEKQPENLVMVISHNERLIAVPRGSQPENGKLKSQCKSLYFSSDTHDYYFKNYGKDSCSHGEENTPGGRTNNTNSSCLRTDGRYEYLDGLLLDNQKLNQWEGWPAGAPEIDLRVFFPINSELLSKREILGMEPGRRNDILNKWWNPNVDIAVWDRNTRGATWAFHFVEDDAEVFIQLKEITISSKFKLPGGGEANLSAKFSIGTKDEIMGGQYLVDFCPNPPLVFAGSPCYHPVTGFVFRLRR